MLTHAGKRLTVASVNRSMPVDSPSEPARALVSLSRFERDWPRHGRSRETPAGRMVARMEAATEYSQLSELLRVGIRDALLYPASCVRVDVATFGEPQTAGSHPESIQTFETRSSVFG